MKKLVNFSLFICLTFVLFFSCQKELSFEDGQVSAGSLKSNITGDCLPKTVAGTYVAGKDLGDTNYIEVEVHVTNTGAYTILTNTVNGYSFKGAGNFSNTGPGTVRLKGTGKPVVAGTDEFELSYDTSICHIKVTVGTVGGGTGNVPAEFTLQGAPLACTPATISGTYVKNVAVNSEDSVNIGLMVTSPGTYTITTNTVNGYSFSGSGVLPAAGVQTISMKATGIPLDVGTNTFTVAAGGSSCTFSVAVTTAVQVTSNDYFPLTLNSYWTYDDLWNTGDTIKRIVTESVLTNGFPYYLMKENDMFGDTIQHLYRKTGNDYFEYGSVDRYTASLSYVPSVFGDMPFLSENLANGDSWTSEEFTGNLGTGQPVITRFDFSCVDAHAAVTLIGKAFINVYKIRLMPQVRSLVGPFASTGEIIDLFYAKGVGLIYVKGTRDGFTKLELQIRNWMVY